MTRTIATAITFAACVLIAYALVVQWCHPVLTKAPTQFLTNRMFIESYVYGSGSQDVLVGSSLTRRLPAGSTGPGVANMAISAGNALTGLEIVVDGEKNPHRVFFEINKIDEGLDQQLVNAVYAEPLYSLRKYVLAARLTYQPMSFLIGFLRGSGRDVDTGVTTQNTRTLIEANRKALLVKLSAKDMSVIIARLRAQVARASARHMQVIFYEMPIAPELADLPRPAQIRDAVHRAFPPQINCWIYPNIPGGAQTADGLHLLVADARAVGEEIRSAPNCTLAPH